MGRGPVDDTLCIRRIGPGKDVGDTPVHLGSIKVPTAVATGPGTAFTEPTGNALFAVAATGDDGRTVSVNARKLRRGA